jgi:hypothetical protein
MSFVGCITLSAWYSGNRLPRQAFPEPPTLPSLAKTIDPDGWLKAIDGQMYIHRVEANETTPKRGPSEDKVLNRQE